MAFSRTLHATSTLPKLLRSPSHPLPALAAFRRRLSPVNPVPADTEHETGYISAPDSELDFLTPVKPSLVKGCKCGFKFLIGEYSATLRLEMPGMKKQDLKLWYEKFILNVTGIAKVEEFGIVREYANSVEIPMGLLSLLKVQETKAELKEGVLKVIIPKLKLEERDDVLIININ